MIQIRSQVKTSGTVLTKEHGVDKGVYQNIETEKQIMKPLVIPVQLHFPTESKDQYHVKPRKGQSRASIKKKMLRFLMPWPYDIPEQPKIIARKKANHTNSRKTNFATTLNCHSS